MDSELNDTDSPFNAPPENVFSSIVTAISGARQTANQEFNRFWDKLTNNTAKLNSTRTHSSYNFQQKPRHQMLASTAVGNEADIARIEAGKVIHGRLVPDNHRGISHIKNAEIQTGEFLDNKNFSIKRKPSFKEDNDASFHPKKILRKEYNTPSLSPAATSNYIKESPKTPLLTQQSLHAESLSPVESKPIPVTRMETPRNTSHSGYTEYMKSPVRDFSPRASPIRAAESPARSSPVKSSPFRSSPLRTSPMRSPAENLIKTGSTKSVRRLTFELEEAFSPRFPLPVGYQKSQTTTHHDSSDPFHSTPLRKDNAMLKPNPSYTRESKVDHINTTTSIDHALTNTLSNVHHNTTTTTTTTSATSLSESLLDTSQSVSNVSKETSMSHNSTPKRFDQEEEDRRIEELERNVSTIKSQMNNYVSYPSIRSPKPSHTITTDIVNNTTLSHKHNLSAQQNEGKVLSPIRPSTSTESSITKFTESSYPRKSTAVRTSTTPDYAAGRSSPLRASTGLPSPAKTSSTYQPPSPYNNSARSSNDTKITPPPAPPAPPPAPRVSKATEEPLTFSPVRDIPNAFLTKRLQSKYAAPQSKYAAPKSIKESQLAPFLGPNIAINDKTPLKPSEKHKSTMRELIQLIPGVKLRKTDKILGPDGKERPNPFWNEIYNRGGRKLY